MASRRRGAVVATDRRKLKIVVKNLVGNALKFTPRGASRSTAGVEHGAAACSSVRDTGIGIAAEHLASVFEMFRQVDGSRPAAYGGVGLGLHIVRRLVRASSAPHVAVTSQPGRGSTFTIRLPLTGPTARAA